jgi:epoxyqueuosine reductase
MITSDLIKEKAIELGFHKVGIAKAAKTKQEQERLNQWLDQKKHADMEWIENRKSERGNIFNYFSEAKTVISLGMNYYVGKDQSDLTSDFKFSNYAWGDDYHLVIKSKLFSLLEFIKNKKPNVKGLVCVDTAPIMEKVWAQRAGLGWQGKHTNLISTDFGSWLFLGEIIIDFELEPDDPFTKDLCGSCTACIDACPTHALGEYELDSGKCISYLTIEHRGDFIEGHDDLDGWIYGCDICQEVCPWNISFSKISEEKYFEPRTDIINNTDQKWLEIDQEKFSTTFKKSAAKRTKLMGLKRNIKSVNESKK